MKDDQADRRSREQMGATVEQVQRILRSQSFSGIRLPVVELPKVELPKFAMIGAEVAEASERWRKAMAPLTEIGERFRQHMEAVQTATTPLAEHLRWIREQDRLCERLEQAGWLPHRSSPFHLLKEDHPSDGELGWLVEEFYRAGWADVSASLRSEIEACDFDQEAKDCFSEALVAHGAGLYRCAPRLLFPEIERVARIELHGGALDKMASQDRLVAAIGKLTPAEMSSTGVAGLRFYKKLTKHLYLHLKDADRVAVAVADPIPNRHAAVHGIVSYTSAKSSLNAVLVADYLLQAISTIKRLAREDADMRSAA